MNNVIERFRGVYAYLSNFYRCTVFFGGITYSNAEAAFQAQKCADESIRGLFSMLEPQEAKRRGRRLALRDDWDSVKLSVMEDVVRAKFQQNPELVRKLIATGDAQLVESNDWNDTFWGVCRGYGENHLGKILMKVREELREERMEVN